ncbi:class II aldolase/adducin family protein [Noviherbaspirillum pedocola]|uniref:Class II aldolase/adducin family protein n=1 Tax=Noviherbaspirillum pedocola TaxID=2801341 RepID=A0A934WAC7_9BURK|nr:class II aldolase/adducin family protein [Noviherbaspirillum pedocola]MBK4738534.1 class II aldolase/adducin family protein [Noviherbaspirillum pedocola]
MSSIPHLADQVPGSSERSLRGRVPDEEWRTRVDLAACYRLVAQYGMTDLIYNHITAKVPGSKDHFLINPYGLLYEEITASSLLKIDLDGNIVGERDGGYGINHAGYIIHSAIHAARHDVGCILHTHTRAGITVASMKCGLAPLTQPALRFYGRASYHDFEGPAVELGEKERLVADLGMNNVLILRNHGLLTCAPTIAEAFLLMQRLETACKIQVDLMSSNAELVEIPPEVREKSAKVFSPPTVVKEGAEGKLGDWNGMREWKALLRSLGRRDPSYRE